MDMLITFFSAFVVFVLCRNTSVESSSLQRGADPRNPAILGHVQKCRRYIGRLRRVLPRIVELDGDATGF